MRTAERGVQSADLADEGAGRGHGYVYPAAFDEHDVGVREVL